MDIKDIILWDLKDKIRQPQKEQRKAIEEKDAAFVLFHDDIQDLDKKVQAVKYKNVVLQGESYAKD